MGPIALVILVALAIALRFVPKLRGYQFTAWILVAVLAAMLFPARFLHVGYFDTRNKWLILAVVQLVMFGMGTQMSLQDFAGILKAPRGVFVGVLCRFTFMPLAGFALIKIFHFDPEIAAGVILAGSCSSGLSSNVMAFIARSNLALSVAVTAVTTVFAVVFTPLWMKVLAGTLVEVKSADMVLEIIKIVLVPIGSALLNDYLKTSRGRGRNVLFLLAAIGLAWFAFLYFGGWNWLKINLPNPALTSASVTGFIFEAIVFGVFYHLLSSRLPWLDKRIPILSMAGIVYFTAVTTAAGHDNLLRVGALLFIVAVIHNAAGYCFGYWAGRAAGLDKNSARSIAFEVGLQNGGMASGIAGALGKLGTLGLAAAVFSPWMNISGSILANYWRKRPAVDSPNA